MQLNKLIKIKTSSAKRVGRGLSSGKGKTSGRGTKGQKSRSGYNIPRSFEGGQTPLIQKLPKKRGFRSMSIKPQTLNLAKVLTKFNEGEIISVKTLKEKGLVSSSTEKVKLVGSDLSKKVRFKNVLLTKKILDNYKKQLSDKSVVKKAPSSSKKVKKITVKK